MKLIERNLAILKRRLLWIGCVVALVNGPVVSLPAVGQTTLRVGDSLPLNHWFADNATRIWMKEVESATDNAVRFEYFPAGQLGKAKDLLSLTQSGVIDIGYVVPTYVQDKMPMSAVAELPGTFSTSCEGTLAFWKLAEEGGALAREEYQPNGVRVLFAIVMPPYQVFSAQRPVEGLRDLAGVKLRTTGGPQDVLVKRLEGVPVRMSAPDLHESLSRGTVDGMVFPAASVLSYDLAGMVKTAIIGENFGSAVLTYMISENRWRKLPQAVRDAMTEAGDRTTRHICAYADRELEADLGKIQAKGALLSHLSAADHRELAVVSKEVQSSWAEALDRRGKSGTEILRAFGEALK